LSTHRSEFITLLGARIHLRRAGKGEPLLFLHGARGVPVWLPIFDTLARRFEVLVPDHPGFGESDTPDWLKNIGDVAFFYLDLFDALGLRQVHLVGTSLGGWIGAEIAVRDCSPLRTMTLISPAGVRVRGIPAGDPFIWSPEETVHNLYFDQALAQKALAQPMTPESLDLAIKNNFAFARLAWQPRLFSPELERWLHRIKTPVQLIWGEEDRLLPIAYARAWLDKLPRAKLISLPRCGHLPHIEQADAVASAVATFSREFVA
jgi:pimeloyl-ACP methyl ester carboxylesterase